MKRILLLLGLFFIASTNASTTNQPTATPGQQAANNSLQDFFSHIPQPTLVDCPFTTDVAAIFQQALALPPALLTPIQQLYSMLAQEAVRAYIEKNQPGLLTSISSNQVAQTKAQASQDATESQTQQNVSANLQTQLTTFLQTSVIPQLTTICQQSDCWQHYLKMFVATSFDYEVNLLSQLHTNEQQMFLAIPHLETAYYSADYVKLRNSSETLRIFLIITDQLRQRMIPTITDWKGLSLDALYDAMQTFKETDFYKLATAFQQATTADPIAITAPLTQGSSIANGFKQYVHMDNGNPTVVPSFSGLMSITNGTLSLIGVGTILFKQSTVTDKTGASYPTLMQTPYFTQLFEEEDNGAGYTPTPLYNQLLIIQGIKLLIGGTSYLFNQANVADTMTKISTLTPAQQGLADISSTTNSAVTPFPNFIGYQPEDLLLLEELDACIQTNNQLNPETTVTPQSFWHDICHALKHAAEAIGKGIENAAIGIGGSIADIAKKAGDFVVHVGTAVIDVAKGFYYLAGVNCLVSGMTGQGFSHYSGISSFNKYLADSANQLADCVDDITSVVSDVAHVAEDVVNLAATIAGQVAGAVLMDPQLATDLTGMIDQIADTVINLAANEVNFFVKAVGDVVVLSYEAVEVLARVIVDTVTGNVADTAQALGQMLNSVVSSILNLASFVLSALASALKSAMAAVAYLVSAITDVIMDVSGYLAAMFTGNWSENWKVRHDIGEHRQLINALIMTTLAVAITVATFGAGAEAGAGMMALAIGGAVMTAGMSVLQIMSAVQQDNQSIQQTDTQINFLKRYEPYVTNNTAVTAATQNKLYSETALKFEVNTYNQERGLVYYQNYLNNYYNNSYALQAYNLSSFYNLITTPDGSSGTMPGIAPADPGYWYGITTGRYDLNPSRGFRIYQSATNSFCQEIAAAPTPPTTPNSTASSLMFTSGQQSPTQAWVAQKDISPVTGVGLENMDIRYRIIYDMDGPFYVGIYTTERYIDTNQLHALHNAFEAQQKNTATQGAFNTAWKALNTYNTALLDFDQHAKCCVMYKGMNQSAPILGVYEHEGQGWITSNQGAVPYERGAWYRMTAQLAEQSATQSTLTVWCWKEDVFGIKYQDAQSKWSYQTNVTRATPMPSSSSNSPYAGSFGVITSGAAVEYQILSPQQTLAATTARTANNTQVGNDLQNSGITPVEQTRELNWQKNYEANFSPIFGSKPLTPASEAEIKAGVYIYTTYATGLPGNALDFVVFLLEINPTLTPSILGVSINSFGKNTPYVVSLITGNVYNNQWQQQSQTYAHVLETYQQQNTIDPKIISMINKSMQNMYAAESGPFKFNNLTVTGNTQAFTSGVFMYTAPSLTPQLSGSDYLIPVYYDATQGRLTASNIAINPRQNNPVNGLVSAITNTFFALEQNGQTLTTFQTTQAPFITITATGMTFPNLYAQLQSTLPTSLQTLISNQQALYQKAINPPPPAQQPAAPSQPVSTNQFAYSGGDFGGLQDGGGGFSNSSSGFSNGSL